MNYKDYKTILDLLDADYNSKYSQFINACTYINDSTALSAARDKWNKISKDRFELIKIFKKVVKEWHEINTNDKGLREFWGCDNKKECDHPKWREIADYGDTARYECCSCGKTETAELPQ